MGDEWEYFPEIKWVDSFWGDTDNDELENPVLVEKRSLIAVIEKTNEMLSTAVPGKENEFESALMTFMDDEFGGAKLGSDKYRRDLVERESEIVQLFESTAPMSGVEFVPGDAVAFTRNKQQLRNKIGRFHDLAIGQYLITLYDNFDLESMLDSSGPAQRKPVAGTPAFVIFNDKIALDCVIKGVTQDPRIYTIDYLDIASYQQVNVRVHRSRIAAPFGWNITALEELEAAQFRVWKPTMVINGTARVINRYPLYFEGQSVKTKQGRGVIRTAYDEDVNHRSEYGVQLNGSQKITYFDVWDFKVENPNSQMWKDFNAKLDILYRNAKKEETPPPTPVPSPRVIPEPAKMPSDVYTDQHEYTRRRLMNEGDVTWWDNRRFFWKFRDKLYAKPIRGAKKEMQKTDKGGIYHIPDFEGKILLEEDEPDHAQKCWEFLNIFVDEMLSFRGYDSDSRFEMTVYAEDDLDDEKISQEDMFPKRLTGDPSFGWVMGDDVDGKIDSDLYGEFSHMDISGYHWLWNVMFSHHTTHDFMEDDSSFLRILNTIAGSRLDVDWKPLSAIVPNEENFRKLYKRASNLFFVMNFIRGTGQYYYGGNLAGNFTKTKTYNRIVQEWFACRDAATELWQRALEPTIYPDPKLLNFALPYRGDFVFDGTQMYWEMWEGLPRPQPKDYASTEAMEAFMRDRWIPYFQSWDYAQEIDPPRFLMGKARWPAELQDSAVKLTLDGKTAYYFFATPGYTIVRQNAELMGLLDRNDLVAAIPKDGRAEMFMRAYHKIVVPTINYPHTSPNLIDPINKAPILRVYDIATGEEIDMREPEPVKQKWVVSNSAPSQPSGGGGGAIIVVAFALLIAFSYSR